MQEFDIMTMTKKDFEEVPELSELKERMCVEQIDGIVIVPQDYLHDSGYACMSFVLCRKHEPIARVGGGSDVIHIDGIGGFGKWEGEIPDKVKPKMWSIDCLPCGYCRLFCLGNALEIDDWFCSDFSVYGVEVRK